MELRNNTGDSVTSINLTETAIQDRSEIMKTLTQRPVVGRSLTIIILTVISALEALFKILSQYVAQTKLLSKCYWALSGRNMVT